MRSRKIISCLRYIKRHVYTDSEEAEALNAAINIIKQQVTLKKKITDVKKQDASLYSFHEWEIGVWIPVHLGENVAGYMCSKCRKGSRNIDADEYEYCPWCGKQMRKEYDPEFAGKALRNAMIRITGQTDCSTDTLAKLGISAYDKYGKPKKFTSILRELEEVEKKID